MSHSLPVAPTTFSAAPLEVAVVFLVFNRPELTARVFERIRAARPTRLYVVADGPRPDRPGEAALCAQVRVVAEHGVDWPCEVIRDYAPANLGCARRVASGLDGVFARETEAIILEDDCLPDPTFFRFCSELLERYRDEPRVGQIAGCTFQGPDPDGPASYYFSRYPHCWGWATWRRTWRHYDHSMRAWRQSHGSGWLAELLPDPAERRYWEGCFEATANGQMDSWAYRWTFALWVQSCLSILPYRNLISNIGFGAEATHTREANRVAALPISAMPFPLGHPAVLARDLAADERTARRVFRRRSMPVRLWRRLVRRNV